jgi:1-deoxy-D-xylulose-5-phosphate synthase
MQRAYDSVIHDVAMQNLHVVFCLDRGGVAGADGQTHHGAYDLAYMRCIPNLIVSAPLNEAELRNLMYTSQLKETNAPFVIRYPRGQGVMTDWKTPMKKIKIGTGQKIRNGEDIAILSIGAIGKYAISACKDLEEKGVDAAHYDLRFVKPLDEVMLHEVFTKFDKIITVEDGCVVGGGGSAVLEFMASHGYSAQVKMLGMPDRLVEHGSQEELYRECEYDDIAIIEYAEKMVGKKSNTKATA